MIIYKIVASILDFGGSAFHRILKDKDKDKKRQRHRQIQLPFGRRPGIPQNLDQHQPAKEFRKYLIEVGRKDRWKELNLLRKKLS